VGYSREEYTDPSNLYRIYTSSSSLDDTELLVRSDLDSCWYIGAAGFSRLLYRVNDYSSNITMLTQNN
jgi:hypothetical protein